MIDWLGHSMLDWLGQSMLDWGNRYELAGAACLIEIGAVVSPLFS
jgi:hypothetical protein